LSCSIVGLSAKRHASVAGFRSRLTPNNSVIEITLQLDDLTWSSLMFL
jgi:hypothetical protein